jgi:hypothetical protein
MMRFRKCGQGQDDTGTARRHGDDTSGATDGDVRNMFSYCKARAFLLVSYKKTFLHTGAMRALNRSIKTTHTGAFICLLQETDEAPPPPAASWRTPFIFLSPPESWEYGGVQDSH